MWKWQAAATWCPHAFSFPLFRKDKLKIQLRLNSRPRLTEAFCERAQSSETEAGHSESQHERNRRESGDGEGEQWKGLLREMRVSICVLARSSCSSERSGGSCVLVSLTRATSSPGPFGEAHVTAWEWHSVTLDFLLSRRSGSYCLASRCPRFMPWTCGARWRNCFGFEVRHCAEWRCSKESASAAHLRCGCMCSVVYDQQRDCGVNVDSYTGKD